jgi:hypothetical protein
MLDKARNALFGSATLQRIFAASRWCFGPAAVVFLIVAGVRARGAFQAVSLHAQLPLLVITVLLWASLNLLSPVFTWIVLREFGANISYAVMLRIQVSRLPAKYLPGGIWQTVSRMMDLHRHGVDRAQLSALVMLENLMPLAMALTMGGACVLVAGDAKYLAFASMLGGLVLLLSLPFLLRHRLLLHRRRFALHIYFVAAFITATFGVIAAAAFSCYWYSFTATHVDISPLQVSGAYLLAWATGFVSIFAPQGIGVFESVISLLLKGILPFGEVAVLAVGFRAAILAADFIVYGTFLVSQHACKVLRRHQH